MTVRVAYLFSGYRSKLLDDIKSGREHDGGVWGMLRLPHYGVQANSLELEQYFSPTVSHFLRNRFPGNYFAHLPLLHKLFSYDAVFTSGAFGTQLVFTMLKSVFRFRRPLWVMHDFSITGFLGDGATLKQKVFRYMVARAGGIVTLGKKEAQMLQDRFPHLAGRVAYIPYGVDAEFFKPLSVPEERLVISVGVDPDRDWPTFFKACDGIDAQVVVTGSRRRTRHYRPPAFVETRELTRPELNGLYSKAAVVVLPLDTSSGINDAMGVSTLYEAMVMGKAIVVSRTHTMESYITDGENGLLVSEHDAHAMHEAIQKLLNDDDLRARLGKAARAYALEHLDPERCSEKLALYFKNLCAN